MSHLLTPGRSNDGNSPSIGDEDLRKAINHLLNYQHNLIQTATSPQQGFLASKFMAIMEGESGFIAAKLLPVMIYCPGGRLGAMPSRGILWVKPSIPESKFDRREGKKRRSRQKLLSPPLPLHLSIYIAIPITSAITIPWVKPSNPGLNSNVQ